MKERPSPYTEEAEKLTTSDFQKKLYITLIEWMESHGQEVDKEKLAKWIKELDNDKINT